MSDKLTCGDCGRDMDAVTALYGKHGIGGFDFLSYMNEDHPEYRRQFYCKKCAKKHRKSGK